jgi:GTP-binding protein
LGHVERTGLLLHLVDASSDDPVEGWRVVRAELDSYGEGLDGKPEIIALSKADLVDDKRRAKAAKALEKASGAKVFPVSAPLEEGLAPLLDAIIERVGSAAEDPEPAEAGKSWSPL